MTTYQRLIATIRGAGMDPDTFSADCIRALREMDPIQQETVALLLVQAGNYAHALERSK